MFLSSVFLLLLPYFQSKFSLKLSWGVNPNWWVEVEALQERYLWLQINNLWEKEKEKINLCCKNDVILL